MEGGVKIKITSKQQLMDFLELGHLSPRGMFYI